MEKAKVLSEIKSFLEGYNNDLKYIVNVEADKSSNEADCVIHEPNKEPVIKKIPYEPFMYMKDLSKTNITLYEGMSEQYVNSKMVKYGITIKKLKTGNQKRLLDGYCYLLTSSKSYNHIVNYLKDGGIDIYEKLRDKDDNELKDAKGQPQFLHRNLFYSVKPTEQFFISNKCRLYKGFEEYKQIHKVTFDIETTGLKYQKARVFTIGVRDNRGFETILEASLLNDDDSEIKLIQDFFNLLNHLRPAIVMGYNSEMFDFDFILGRAKELRMNIDALPTSLKKDLPLKRRFNTPVKYGNTPDRYTWTDMWGMSVIDIIHAVKRTAAVNSEIKENKLKYIAKFEKIARPNRTYIAGEDNFIGKYYAENKIFVIDESSNYIQLPDEYQSVGKKLYQLQANKPKLSDEQYKNYRNEYLKECPEFVTWFKAEALPKNLKSFISGKKLVKQYLLDDLWETEQVDGLYNQSSFLLAKIVPTTYQRICTMGTAGIWNLLLTTWSYENDLAIPIPDVYLNFSGGLARTYKKGFAKRVIKIDYAGLYPSIQLTEGVFPMFDITNVMKKILLYLTTTRNIYKKLGNSVQLNEEELTLFMQVDAEMYQKYINNQFTPADVAMFKIKQLPIKILNNSLYGALGSNVSFNWSDNICAARITCTARLHLRHAVSWFTDYGCVALLAVTDGINFHYPEKTNIRFNNEGMTEGLSEGLSEGSIEELWQYNGKTGISALIEKYNAEEMKPPYMSVDNDGVSEACFNLARINYATLSLVKDKKSDQIKEKIKLTGNTVKSKTMSGYIEDFMQKGLDLILHDKGAEFVDYYNHYAGLIYHKEIPLKKIATKSRLKKTISEYNKRGKNKNGKEKGKQAHMELLIEKRNKLARELFEKHKDSLGFTKSEEKLTDADINKLVINYMPPEPEQDTVIYFVNTGTKASDGNSDHSTLITAEDLLDNPDMKGSYNVAKYLNAFNKRVSTLLVGFDPEIAKKIPSKIVKDKKTKELTFVQNQFPSYDLGLKLYDLDDYDSSMYMEDKEVDFWNKTAYDPRKVWDKFKMREDYKIHYEIYDNALKHLNDLMISKNQPLIKSINNEYKDGDLVLIKNNNEYNVGKYNGAYLEIIRENVKVPKSEFELEEERLVNEEKARVDKYNIISLSNDGENSNQPTEQELNRIKYFSKFKKRFDLSKGLKFEEYVESEENAFDLIDGFIEEIQELGFDDEEDDDDNEI